MSKIRFSVLGFGQRGIKGVNAQRPKLLIEIWLYRAKISHFMARAIDR